MNSRRTGLQRRFQIDNGVERLDVDDDISNRIFRDIAAVRDDHRDRLADVADLVAGQRPVGARVKHETGDRRRRHEKRCRPAVVAEIRERVDRRDAGALPGRRHVDLDQPSVRVIAPDERHVQRSRQLHVVDEARPPGEQAGILVAADPCVNVSRFG